MLAGLTRRSKIMQAKKPLSGKILGGLAVAVSAAILGGAALAHAGDPAGGDCGGPQHWGAKHGDPQAAMQKHLDKLKADLKIQPSQEGAWQAYESKVQAQGAKMKVLHQQATTDTKTLTLPERLDQRTAFMKQREADMEDMNTSLKALYAVLTPEQRAIMDKDFAHGKGRHI
jgi:protein CpxP